MENEGAVSTEQAPESATMEGATPAGDGATAKTYNESQVAEIVSKRVNELNGKYKGYQELEKMGLSPDQIKQQYIARQEEAKKSSEPQLTQEDKNFRAYLEKHYPKLAKLGEYEKTIQAQDQAIRSQYAQQFQSMTQSNIGTLKKLAAEQNYPEKSFQAIDNAVAESIRSNPEDLKKYFQGDQTIVEKHFKTVNAMFSEIINSKTADYARDKAKTGKLPARMPQGGVHAPTSKKQAMTKEEQVQAAFDVFSKG